VTPDLVVGRWGAHFRGRWFPCAVGRGGIGEKQAEGDGITPAGRHAIEAVFWRPERLHNPCTSHAHSMHLIMPIGPPAGWSDDPADPDYNRVVRRPHGFHHEALRRADPQYDLVAVLDWNRHPVVAGRGSAIFLHVWRGPRRPTAGCVAFRRENLAWILARWTPRSRVVVFG
jgi:L,D-peptidoglycan transpeptidase YkuD (ErfK/YbiS/YcfS/YnhG family)